MNMPTVQQHDIENALLAAGLTGRPVCLHSSLRSFGYVEGGASTIVQGFLAAGCTLLVPTFSWSYAVPIPVDQRIQQNGWDYETYAGPTAGIGHIFSTTSTEIDSDMGAIPAAILRHAEAMRGNHPICSFTALGPLAGKLTCGQHGEAVYAPLDVLAELGGFVLLAGVALDKMTLLHLAEQKAGRNLFRRFANDANGEPAAVEVGGCSDGFEKLAETLHPLRRTIQIGESLWQIFPARQTLTMAAAAIQADPWITHCGQPDCDRCNDAVKGGPIG